MKRFLVPLIVLTGLGYAQQTGDAERKVPPDDHSGTKAPAAIMRRLEAVTWDPLQSELIWCVSVWDLESDMTEPDSLERYVIHVNQGVMESNGERRPVDVPGEDLHALMNIISAYAMRSTVWWRRAGAPGDPATPGEVPDGKNGGKDKPKGNDQDNKPKLPPVGKAVASQEQGLGTAGHPSIVPGVVRQ